jgi:serine/threonine protein kinase
MVAEAEVAKKPWIESEEAMDNRHESSGLILDNRYRLLELLGEGGSGSTYRAIRLSDEMVVAIKVLSLQHLHDWKQLELFEREAQILARLNHPQIPKYLEYFHVDTPTDRAFYIVQQLAPGQPLNALVQSGWHGTEAEIKSIAQQLLEILQYLQAQSPPLIHRDIKPHNIVRSVDGQVFLVDFGAVQATYHNTLMKGNTVAGTYGYMAPEQFRGRAIPASDLYGLGATVLYLLTHRSPADLPQERLKVNFRSHVSLSISFADWLETMLEPDEADRFSSADKALQALTSNRYRRANPSQKNDFPWRSTAAAVALFAIGLPMFHQYRYAFLTLVGLQPSDLCQSIRQNESSLLDDYLNHGGNHNVEVEISNDYNGSLLHCAVTARKLNIVKNLVKRGADITKKDSSGRTTLHRLVDQFHNGDDREFVEIDLQLLEILTFSGQTEATDDKGESALFLAVRQRKIEMIRKLIALGANPKTENRSRANLAHALAWDDHLFGIKDIENRAKVVTNQPVADILKILIDARVDIDKANRHGDRPLHTAINSYNSYMVEQLLARGVNSQLPNQEGRTPLMAAIDKAHIWAIDALLEKGAKVNDQDTTGATAISILIQSQNWGGVSKNSSRIRDIQVGVGKRLFELGANPNLSDQEGSSPLHFLVAAAAANFQNSDWANQCFHLATSSSNSLLTLLLEKGSNPQAVNNKGETALHLAFKNSKVFKQLVDAGWNPLQLNREGISSLQLLAEHKNVPAAMITQMLSTGKNINTLDRNGNSILHRTMSIYQAELSTAELEKTISLLVEMGASMDIKNKAGQTPLVLARQIDEQRHDSKSHQARAYLNQCKIEVDRQRQGTPK